MPAELAEAMDADTRRFFDGLSYSRRQRCVLPVEQAKTPETRQRRIGKTLTSLRRREPEP